MMFPPHESWSHPERVLIAQRRIVEEFIQHGAHMLAVASVEQDRVERILRVHLVSRTNLNGQSEGVDGETRCRTDVKCLDSFVPVLSELGEEPLSLSRGGGCTLRSVDTNDGVLPFLGLHVHDLHVLRFCILCCHFTTIHT